MDLQTLVGRAAEVTLLSGLVRGVAAGHGGALLVEGEPGIGKTALVEAGLTEAARLGCTVARAAGDELTRRFPLRVLLDALEIGPRSTDPRRSRVADTLRGGHTGSLTATGNPAGAAAEELLALVERLCAEAPLVLAVDDLQWVDETSLALWRRMAQLTDQVPLLIIGACRPVPVRDELDAVRNAAQARGHAITLAPLSDGDVVRLLARLVTAEPDDDLRRLVAPAAGNPLWLREIVDALIQQQAVTVRDGRAGLALDDYHLPTSLFAAVARRLTYLSRSAIEVMRTAALLGIEFTVVDVAAVLGKKPSDLLATCEEALTARVVGEVGDRLAFRHPLIHQALYEDVPDPVRSSLHLVAGRALAEAGAPASTVAAQLIAAGGGTDAWQVEWLARHGPVLINQSLEVGVELLRRAADSVRHDADGSDPVVEEVSALLARALHRFGPYGEARVRARQVLETTSVPDRAAEMREILSDLLLREAKVDEAFAMAREGVDQADLSPVWRARLLAQLAAVQESGQGDVDGAEATAWQAVALGTAAHDRYAVGSAMWWLASVSASRGDLVAMNDFVERGLDVVGDDPSCLRIRLLLLLNHMWVLHLLDRMPEAEQAIRVTLEVAEHAGGMPLIRAYRLIALHAFGVGRWDDALAYLDDAADEPGSDTALVARGIAALIAGHRYDRPAAVAQLELIAHVSMSRAGTVGNMGFALAARSLLAEQSGDHAAALSTLATVLEPEYSVMEYRFEFLPDVVRLALAIGDRQIAQTAVATAEADAARTSAPGPRAALGRSRGLLVGDPAPVLAAADHYRACGRVLALGNTLEDASTLLATSGDVEAARLAFREAADVYTHLGATWDLRRADARLRPFGVRRGVRGTRQRPDRGWDSLSPTEVTVAQLVTAGRSNPDIALELLLSRRTVQSHVSHILFKLGVRSRAEIARDVAEHAV